jgi:hypothetical protein
MATRKRTDNDLLNTTQKTKDRAKRTPLSEVIVFESIQIVFILKVFDNY